MIIGNKQWTKFKAGTIIRQKLLQDPSVRAIIGTRMGPLEKLEGSETGPFILYEMADYSVNETKQGIYNQSVNMGIGCTAPDYDATMNLAEAVFNCLHNFYDYEDTDKKIIINRITLIDMQQTFLEDNYCTTLKFKIE